MSTVNYRETMANGNRVQLWGQSEWRDDAARRVAAALPRAAPHVRAVEADISDDRVVIWYEAPDGDAHEFASHEIPAGWTVVAIDHFSAGTVALTVRPVREAGR